jgi:Delta7-sterol 5-desaturase
MFIERFFEILAGINWPVVVLLWTALAVSGQIRYGILAGAVNYISTTVKKEKWLIFKVKLPFVSKEHISKEKKQAVISSLIFSTIEFFVIVSNSFGLTKLYFNISDYGIPYFIASIFIMIVLHDAYFYWSHRLLHWKRIYRQIHGIHHESVSPTSYTSFYFHPVEAVMQLSILPLILFIMPVHWISLSIFLTYMTFFNIIWHNSYEFWPRITVRSKILGLFSTPTHHNIHHERVNYNYGLYLTIWDKLMGTMHPNYETIFEAVKDRTPASISHLISIQK